MSDKHPDHDHSHAHDGVEGDVEFGYHVRLGQAMEALLVEKGVCSTTDIQHQVDRLARRSVADGAKVVAQAWVDPEFKGRLLADPKAAVAELGYTLNTVLGELRVVENTEKVHHLVVCTLCSCYPTSLLGRPPDWYKSLAYRSRAVGDPRGVMREFGLELGDGIEVSVVDSTADLRYMVLPRRPEGTEHLGEEELAKLVTRDSMIGVANPLSLEPMETR